MMDRLDVESPEFWLAQWNRAVDRSAWAGKRGYAAVETWNRMSRDYDKGLDAQRRPNQDGQPLVQLLLDRGLLREGMRVLDVGCGTGRVLLPMAEAGASVVGLDFSEGMLDRLRENRGPAERNTLELVQADWDRVDLAARGWKGAFDLALACMTPAIHTPDSFLKLLDASREACCFRGWAGRRSDPLLEELWRHLLGVDMPPNRWDITLAFNLLRSMGYAPSISFHDIGWERCQSVAEAAEFFTGLLEGWLDEPERDIHARITTFLEERAEDGKVCRRTTGQIGTMTWKLEGT